MSSSIRPVRSSDREAILALAPRLKEGVAPWRPRRDVIRAVTGWVTSSLEEASNPDRTLLVAVEGSVVTGFISVSESSHWSGGRDGYIGELVVDHDHEGRGIGTSLVQGAMKWAEERGLSRVTVETGVRNQRARRLYESLGFQEEGITLSIET